MSETAACTVFSSGERPFAFSAAGEADAPGASCAVRCTLAAAAAAAFAALTAFTASCICLTVFFWGGKAAAGGANWPAWVILDFGDVMGELPLLFCNPSCGDADFLRSRVSFACGEEGALELLPAPTHAEEGGLL